MLSKNKIKYIQSLALKKFRQKYNQFIIEGPRITNEAINFNEFLIKEVFFNQVWEENQDLKSDYHLVTDKLLQQASLQKKANQVIAICDIPKFVLPQELNKVSLFLENVQDPGNVGTILRLADWFGIEAVFLNVGCADIFSPKVVQASMGAIFRVPTFEISIQEFKNKYTQTTLLAADLEGENIFDFKIKHPSCIIIGNEGKGLSEEMRAIVDQKITIPKDSNSKMESLNAALSAGIIIATVSKASL